MFYDSFDMGNPDQKVIPDHDANRVMESTRGLMWINTHIPGKKSFFPGITSTDRKVGATVTVATVTDGAVVFSEGIIAPHTTPAGGFYTEGGASVAHAQDWGVWITPPAEEATVIVWSVRHVLALKVTSTGQVSDLPAQNVKLSFTHDPECWVVGEVILTQANGTIQRVTKLAAVTQAPPKGKKARRMEEATDVVYTPPEVVVESPFAALLRGRK